MHMGNVFMGQQLPIVVSTSPQLLKQAQARAARIDAVEAVTYANEDAA